MQKISKESAEKAAVEVQNSTKERERKAKAKESTQKAESKTSKFPVQGKINKYCFIYLESDVFSALGLSKGVEQKITIDLQEGALMVRKV